MSSPLPPSPSVMFSAFAAKAREAQGSKGKVEKSSIWDIPDDVRDLGLLPSATKNKRASKAVEHAGAKKPKTRKATEKSKAEKKAPLRNGKIQAKVIKSPLETSKKSKYFSEKQQELPDILITLGPVPKNAALAPKSPNQELRHEPPLHVIRRQWTPVKDTDFPLDSSPHLANGEPKMDKISVFNSVINSMRYSTESSENASVSIDNCAENVLVKKRAIEVRNSYRIKYRICVLMMS